jgi:hypothetical protein
MSVSIDAATEGALWAGAQETSVIAAIPTTASARLALPGTIECTSVVWRGNITRTYLDHAV